MPDGYVNVMIACLLASGYAAEPEDAFDRAIRDVRDGPPLLWAPRDTDFQD